MWDTTAFYAALTLKKIVLHVINMPAALVRPAVASHELNNVVKG